MSVAEESRRRVPFIRPPQCGWAADSTFEIHAQIAMGNPNASRSGGSGKGRAVPA